LQIQDNNPFLICSGFHRSATSATTRWLSNAGVKLGDNLMGSNVHNPKGYYEDKNVVALHNELLHSNQTSWQSTSPIVLTQTPLMTDYLASRESEYLLPNDVLGFKDPRALLFLPHWHQALQGRGRYLFVIRHWSSCIESLLNRHSKNLAYSLKPIKDDNLDIQFWSNPTLAAKMWLNYNSQLFLFAKRYPQQVMVVSQRSLFDGIPLIAQLNDRFNLTLNQYVAAEFDNHLLRDTCSSKVVDGVSTSLRCKLDTMWEGLLKICDSKSHDELPHITNVLTVPDDIKFTPKAFTIENVVAEFTTASPLQSDIAIDTNSLPVSPVIAQLKVFTSTINKPGLDNASLVSLNSNLNQILDDILSSKDDNILSNAVIDCETLLNVEALPPASIFSLAKVMFFAKQYQAAIAAFRRIADSNKMLFGCYVHLAKCYDACDVPAKAIEYYELANAIKINNPQVLNGYANALLKLKRKQDAEIAYLHAIEVSAENINAVFYYADFLVTEHRYDEAKERLQGIADKFNNNKALGKLANLNMLNSTDEGIAQYKQHVLDKLQSIDKPLWLAEILQYVDNADAENDLLLRVNGHWACL
jgi:tetratricopeptide (TPR) repeat protein